MALPSPSQPISASQIRTEYGGSNPFIITQYYRGGSLVYNCAANQYVPTSGKIALADFWTAAKPLWVGVFTSGSSGTKIGFSAADGFGSATRVHGTATLNYLYYDSNDGRTYFDTNGANGVSKKMTKANPRIAEATIVDGSFITGVAFGDLAGTFELCIWNA